MRHLIYLPALALALTLGLSAQAQTSGPSLESASADFANDLASLSLVDYSDQDAEQAIIQHQATAGPAFYDGKTVIAPEPESVAVLALAGLLLATRRRSASDKKN